MHFRQAGGGPGGRGNSPTAGCRGGDGTPYCGQALCGEMADSAGGRGLCCRPDRSAVGL